MSFLIREIVAKNLRTPQKGIGGFFAEKFLIKRCTPLIINTVSLADIQPDHVVLEVGYGPGVGLEEAWKRIKDGKGKVYGIDLSEAMFKCATKRLSALSSADQVNIAIGDVMKLPFEDNSIDRVFHTNCFYFWPDQLKGAQELYRVMSPGAFMVTGMYYTSIQQLSKHGFLKYGNTDGDNYMTNLTKAGFCDVRRENVKCEMSGADFTMIYASVQK